MQEMMDAAESWIDRLAKASEAAWRAKADA
jgi:hypothetical protein